MTIKSRIKKVNTLKAGPFYFSAAYDEREVELALREAEVRYASIAHVPLIPNFANQLEEELIRKSIFGTAAIEGNPLSEESVNRIIDEEEAILTQDESKQRAEQEILNLRETYYHNLKDAYSTLRKIPIDKFSSLNERVFNEELIKLIHNDLTTGIKVKENDPGRYRSNCVKVGNTEHGGIYTPPKIFKDIKNLMEEFVLWINSEEMLQEHTAIRAALAHYHLALIHPFGDGNGRTARLIEAILLQAGGYKFVPAALSNYYYQNLDDYYWAFSKTRKDPGHTVTHFLLFFLKGLNECLKSIQEKINDFTRRSLFLSYYMHLLEERKINRKIHSLLTTLLKDPITFDLETLRILLGRVSEITARRALKKLFEFNLIREVPGKKRVFELNKDILN